VIRPPQAEDSAWPVEESTRPSLVIHTAVEQVWVRVMRVWDSLEDLYYRVCGGKDALGCETSR
jgi:hypothetical protein